MVVDQRQGRLRAEDVTRQLVEEDHEAEQCVCCLLCGVVVCGLHFG